MCECPASAAQDLAGKQGSRRRTFVACRFGRRLCCRCLFGRPPCCRFGRPLCCRCRRDLCCRCRRRCRCRWVVDGGGRARALWGVVLSLGVCALALRGFALTVALGAALLGALAFALLASCLGSFPPLASPWPFRETGADGGVGTAKSISRTSVPAAASWAAVVGMFGGSIKVSSRPRASLAVSLQLGHGRSPQDTAFASRYADKQYSWNEWPQDMVVVNSSRSPCAKDCWQTAHSVGTAPGHFPSSPSIAAPRADKGGWLVRQGVRGRRLQPKRQQNRRVKKVCGMTTKRTTE